MDRSRPTPTADLPTRMERLSKNTLRVQIVEQLRSAILGGDLPPGCQLIETALAEQFGVSRGPLREATRQLIDEGLLVAVPYTGTYVTGISADEVDEIYSFRTALETFAFEQVWPKRDEGFADEMGRRHAALTATINRCDDQASILAELDLHGLVYETSKHQLLLQSWTGLRGRLQLYWAAHHRAHGISGPRRDSHDSYITAALGKNLGRMRAEVQEHMQRGLVQTQQFLRSSDLLRPGIAA